MSEDRNEGEDAAAPLTGSAPEAAAPMRLRADAPRVTRLSRKVLAGLGLVASLGIGGALVYALQTRNGGRAPEELYSTDNRNTADGLQGLPRDYSSVPQLGPPLPGDLGRPIVSAQNRGQPVPNPGVAAPQPGLSAEEQRRLQEIETARTSRLFAAAEARNAAPVTANTPNQAPPGPRQPRARAAAGNAERPRSAAGLSQRAGRPTHCCGRPHRRAGLSEYPSSRRRHLGRSHHRRSIGPSGPDHRPGHREHL